MNQKQIDKFLETKGLTNRITDTDIDVWRKDEHRFFTEYPAKKGDYYVVNHVLYNKTLISIYYTDDKNPKFKNRMVYYEVFVV